MDVAPFFSISEISKYTSVSLFCWNYYFLAQFFGAELTKSSTALGKTLCDILKGSLEWFFLGIIASPQGVHLLGLCKIKYMDFSAYGKRELF